jgi:hypothetical protein
MARTLIIEAGLRSLGSLSQLAADFAAIAVGAHATAKAEIQKTHFPIPVVCSTMERADSTTVAAKASAT